MGQIQPITDHFSRIFCHKKTGKNFFFPALTRYKYSNGRTRKRGTMDDRILLISLMLRRR